MPRPPGRRPGEVSLDRALSKLGLASRAEARRLIAAGRVRLDGRPVVDPSAPVVPERAAITIDGEAAAPPPWTTILLHKPRGVVTTSRDPEGRATVFDLVSGVGVRLIAVGRLDLATTGLLLLTTDTRLAAWLTDPVNAVPRTYLVTARGEVSDESQRAMLDGIDVDGEQLRATDVTIRKRSARETHLALTLTEGRNREVRRLFEARGHEVTRLKRVAYGGLVLGDLEPGTWCALDPDDVQEAFPGAPIAGASRAR
jgi:23S rRNA pseudouridine2605 synthase